MVVPHVSRKIWLQDIEYTQRIWNFVKYHYNDVIMGEIASQITSDQRKHQSSASLAFVWGIHRWPVNSPHKWAVMRKMFPFDDVIMCWSVHVSEYLSVCVHPSLHPSVCLFIYGVLNIWIVAGRIASNLLVNIFSLKLVNAGSITWIKG